MKKLAGFAFLLLFAATTALAVDAPRPDYSKDALLSFTAEVLRQRAAERVDIDFGAIDIYHFGTHFKLLWLPFLGALPGTTLKEAGSNIPNAFALTNTRVARSMPYMPDDDTSSAVKSEMRRVLKLEKRAKLKVSTE